jgi:hypothetical protein
MKPKTSESTKFFVTNMDEYMKLPGSTIRTLEKLWTYNIPDDIVKRLKKGFPFNSMTSKEVGICVDEFKKFVAIMIIGKKEKKGVAMTSNVIDEIWHEFVLFTLDYHAFSEMLDLQYIHHTPNTKSFSFGPNAAQFFFDTYKKYFGELHPIWYYTMVEEEVSETTNVNNSSTINAILYKSEIDDTSEIQYTKKYRLIKKQRKGSPLLMTSTGTPSDKNSSGSSCGGIFYCGAYTSGYGGSDTSSVSESVSGGGGFWSSFGGDGGDAGGCGGCGGCGG